MLNLLLTKYQTNYTIKNGIEYIISFYGEFLQTHGTHKKFSSSQLFQKKKTVFITQIMKEK